MRSKVLALISILLLSSLLGGCQLMEMFGSVKDVTSSANSLIEEIDETIREVNNKADSGQLDEEVADMTEAVLARALDQISVMLEKNKGTLVGSANGVIDNVFANISDQLDQIKEGYLDDSFPKLIDQIATDMEHSLTRLSAETQDIIMLTAGNVFVAVDKATNSMITILSVILLAIGLLILMVALLRARDRLNGARIAGVVFGGIYILFFLAILVIAPFRGYVIAGFNYGVEVEAKALEPKITGISPADFTFGEDDSITIYGNHLNLLENLSIQLVQGSEVKKLFVDSSIAVATRYNIVIGNLTKEPNGWTTPDYDNFEEEILQAVPNMDKNQLADIAIKIKSEVNQQKLLSQPSDNNLMSAPKVELKPQSAIIEQSVKSYLPSSWVDKYSVAINDYFTNHFGLSQGDYGVVVYSGEDRIESPQHIYLANPIPPAPKPDITPYSLQWTTSKVVENESASMAVHFKITNPGEIKKPFKVKVIEMSSGNSWTGTAELSAIAKAEGGNICEVIVNGIFPSSKGEHKYKVVLDSDNEVVERYDNNNEDVYSLQVSQYVYDAHVVINTYNPTRNHDSSGNEYRVTVSVALGGEQKKEWKGSFNDGRAGRTYNLDWSTDYWGLTPGKNITIATSGYEADNPDWGDSHDYMGSKTQTVEIKNSITDNKASKDLTYILDTGHYKVSATVKVTRRIQ